MPSSPAYAHHYLTKVSHCTCWNFFRIGFFATRLVKLLIVFHFAAYASQLEPLTQHSSNVVAPQPLSHFFFKNRKHHLSSFSFDSRPSRLITKHGEAVRLFLNDPSTLQYEPLSRHSVATVAPHTPKGTLLPGGQKNAPVFVPLNLYGFPHHPQQNAIQGSRSPLPFQHLYPSEYLLFQPSPELSPLLTSFSQPPLKGISSTAACCKVSRLLQSNIYFYCLASTGNCEDFGGVPVLLVSGHYLQDPSECPSNQLCPSPERVVLPAVSTALPNDIPNITVDQLQEKDSITPEEVSQLRRIREKLQAYQENAEQWRQWPQRDADLKPETLDKSNAQKQKTAQTIAVRTEAPRRDTKVLQAQPLTLSRSPKKRREHRKPSVRKPASIHRAAGKSESWMSSLKDRGVARDSTHGVRPSISPKPSREGRSHAAHSKPAPQHEKENTYVSPSGDPALFPRSDSRQHT